MIDEKKIDDARKKRLKKKPPDSFSDAFNQAYRGDIPKPVSKQESIPATPPSEFSSAFNQAVKKKDISEPSGSLSQGAANTSPDGTQNTLQSASGLVSGLEGSATPTIPTENVAEDNRVSGLLSKMKTSDGLPAAQKETTPEFDATDPVKSILAPIKSKINFDLLPKQPFTDATGTARPMEFQLANRGKSLKEKDIESENAKVITDYGATKQFLKENLFPTINQAKEYVDKAEHPNTETFKLAKEKVDEYDNTVKEVESAPSLELYALRKYRQENPQFDKMVKKLEEQHPNFDENQQDYRKLIGNAMMGRIVASQVLTDPNIKEYVEGGSAEQHNKDEYNNLKTNILNEYPEFGINVVANEVSRERQKRGLNSKWANFNTEQAHANTDKVAEDLYKDDPTKKSIYDKYIKDNQKQYIDVPGFLNAVSGGIEKGLHGVSETFSRPNMVENIQEEINKSATNVSADAKGWYKTLSEMGDMTGFVMQMAAGGAVMKGVGIPAAVADKAMVVSNFLGTSLNEGNIKYPDDKIKAAISGLSNTAAFAVLSDIFPASKVTSTLNGVKQEISKAITELGDANVSKAAIKDALSNGFKRGLDISGDFAKQHGKSVLEMLALTKFNQGLDKALGLDDEAYKHYHPESEDIDVVKSMAVANIIPSSVASYGSAARRNFTKEAIWDFANNPIRGNDVVDKQQLPENEAKSIKDKIQFLADTKNVLDEHDIADDKQKTYLLHAANEKQLEQQLFDVSAKAANIQDPVLRGVEERKLSEIKNHIEQSRAIKEKILKSEDLKEPDTIPQDFKEEPKAEDLSPDDQLFQRAYDTGHEGIVRTLDAAITSGDKKAGIEMLRDQSLSATKALYDQLKDKELVTDIIASNKKEDIVDAIMKQQQALDKELAKEEPAEDVVHSLDRSVKWLEEGLKKATENEISKPIELNPNLPEDYVLPEKTEQNFDVNIPIDQNRELDNGSTPTEEKIVTDAATINPEGDNQNKQVDQSTTQTGADQSSTGEAIPPAEGTGKVPEGDGGEGYTHINKEDISTAKEIATKNTVQGGAVTWDESVGKAIDKLAKEAKDGETISDVAARNIGEWGQQIEKEVTETGKSTFNPNDEDLATMSYYRASLNEKLSGLKDALNSDDTGERLNALKEAKDIQDKILGVDYVLSESGKVAGRSFYIRQMTSKMDAENSLLVKRMDIMSKQGGDPLTSEQEKNVAEVVAAENKLNKEAEENIPKYSQEDFDAKVKAEVDKQMKAKKPKEKWQYEKKARNLAAKIMKAELPSWLKADLPDNTKMQGIDAAGLKKLLADATINMGKLLDKGIEFTEAVKEAVKDLVVALGKDREDEIIKGFSEDYKAGVSEKDILKQTIDGIRELAEKEKTGGLTKSAVGKGLINDLVNHYIDTGLRGKYVFDELNKDLKNIFPEITEQQVRDAYLKEGEFKLDKSEKINKEKIEAKAELSSIAKRETDLQDLEDYRNLRKRSFKSDREKTDYENKLIEEKNTKLKEISDRKNQIIEDNKKVEAETIRQMKRVTDLTEKIGKLNRGIRDKRVVSKNIDTPEIEGLKKEVEQADKDLRTAESEASRLKKEAQDKNDKLGELNANIKRVQNGLEQIKTYRNKSDAKIDADILAKRNELQKELDKKGIKLERGSKKEVEIKRKVAESHNKRMDGISGKIDEKLKDDSLSPEEKTALKEVKNAVELSKVNPDTAEKIDNALNKAADKLRNSMVDIAGSKHGDTFDEVSNSLGGLSKELKDARQDVLLDNYKKNLQQKIEEATNKIDNSEFDDTPPAIRSKSDAESIRLEHEYGKINSRYRRLQEQAINSNKTWWEKGIRLGQSFLVNELIGGLKTAEVVLASGLTKQPLNTFTNFTFGSLAHLINPELSKAAGAESPFSLLQEYHRYRAHYAAIGEAGAKEIFNKAKIKLDAATQAYNDNPNNNTKKALEKALLNHQANFIYDWLGSNAWKDAGDVFLKGASRLDELMGKAEKVGWKDMSNLEKTEFVMGMMGASHGYFKNFSARAEFAAAFTARLENKQRSGVDISQPDEILRTANQSMVNYLMGKYQEDNYITTLMNRVGKLMEEVGNEPNKYGVDRRPANATIGKVASAAWRAKYPIIKTGVNIGREAFQEYLLGALFGGVQHGKAVVKGILHGIKEAEPLRESISNEIKKMSPDKVDFIFRCYRKGGLGLVMIGLAAMGFVKFGGYYNDDDYRRKKGQLKQGEVELFGHKYDHSSMVAKIMMHTAAVAPALMTGNTVQVYDRMMDKKGATKLNSAFKAVTSDVEGAMQVVPVLHSGMNPLMNPSVPFGRTAGDISEYFDTDKNGNTIERDKSTWWNRFKVNTGFRETVPIKKK